MKKIVFCLIFMNIFTSIFTQEFEVFRSLKFNNNFPYFVNEDYMEGPYAGIKDFFIDQKGNCYCFIQKNHSWIKIDSKTQEQTVIFCDETETDASIPYWTYVNNDYIFGLYNFGYKLESFVFFKTSENCEIKYQGRGRLYSINNNSFYMDDYLFLANNDNRLFLFDFSQKGNLEYKNIEQTESFLTKDFINRFNICIQKRNNGKYNPLKIGNTYLSNLYSIFNLYNLDESKIKGDETSILDIRDYGYKALGVDDNGLFYFIKYTSEKSDSDSGRAVYTGKEIKYSIAVEDIWTKKIYIYDYEKGMWNPPRRGGKVTGEFNGYYPWFVSYDGNIFYIDADVNKGEYQIKKVNNLWEKDINISTRKIGKLNNKTSLVYDITNKTQSMDFYYLNDIVWELDRKDGWSKVKTLLGKEGWIESKFIDFNSSKKVDLKDDKNDNLLVNSIMKVKENLRLRKTEELSSEILLVMKQGTSVNILEIGKPDVIDGVKSNWVKIETVKDGISGWCFAGYLE